MAHQKRTISFKNGVIAMAGDLHLPPHFDEQATYPALVIATPGSSVKEQIGACYGQQLAARGFVVLVFDPSHQGDSGGAPRDLEDPAARVEDLRCAVDLLVTLPFVDAGRIGLLGICAGGGYAVNAALTEARFKAVGTVVAVNIGRALRQMLPMAAVQQTLLAVGQQRSAEARGGAERRDPWIPDSLREAEAAGLTDPDLLDAVRYYRESAWRHPHASNRLNFRSHQSLLGFDAFHLVPELLTQPLLVIVGGRRGATGSYDDGQALFEMAPASKDFVVIEGAGHYDLYHRAEYVEQAIDRLVPFFNQYLGVTL